MASLECPLCGTRRVLGRLIERTVAYCPNDDCSDHELLDVRDRIVAEKETCTSHQNFTQSALPGVL